MSPQLRGSLRPSLFWSLASPLPWLLALGCAPVLAQAPAPTPAPTPVPTQAAAAAGRWYTPGPFDGVEVSGAAVIRYQQGPKDQVFVEGDDDAQQAVALELRGGLLSIRPAGAWKFWATRRSQITVQSMALSRLVISGAADWLAAAPVQVGRLVVNISGAGLARFDHLKAEQLNFGVSGAGDGQVAGTVQQLEVRISGRSDFRGEQLMSQRARVTVSGIGDVKVWATDELLISVAGVGNVDYWGSAQVQRRAAGVARITDRGPKSPVTPVAPVAPTAPQASPPAPATPAPPAPLTPPALHAPHAPWSPPAPPHPPAAPASTLAPAQDLP
jgi:hypothetical protein